MARPYVSLGIDDLVALSADPTLRDAIIHELSFRRTSKAQALFRRLGGTKPSSTGQSFAESGSGESYQKRYEALRQTFSEAGDLLAQWGMTEMLPPNIIKIVIHEWELIITSGQDANGQKLEDLEKLKENLERLGILSDE